MRNQWGTFRVSAVEAARLRQVAHSDVMRRAVTLVLTQTGGYVAHAGGMCPHCLSQQPDSSAVVREAP